MTTPTRSVLLRSWETGREHLLTPRYLSRVPEDVLAEDIRRLLGVTEEDCEDRSALRTESREIAHLIATSQPLDEVCTQVLPGLIITRPTADDVCRAAETATRRLYTPGIPGVWEVEIMGAAVLVARAPGGRWVATTHMWGEDSRVQCVGRTIMQAAVARVQAMLTRTVSDD